MPRNSDDEVEEMLFGEVLSRYYTLVFIMVILLYTLFFNKMMYSKVGGRFLMIICLVILETIFLPLKFIMQACHMKTVDVTLPQWSAIS